MATDNDPRVGFESIDRLEGPHEEDYCSACGDVLLSRGRGEAVRSCWRCGRVEPRYDFQVAVRRPDGRPEWMTFSDLTRQLVEAIVDGLVVESEDR